MAKTPEEIAAEEARQKEHREQLAKEANKRRNDALLEARNAIADSADRVKEDEDDLVDLTDEVWDQEDRPENAKPKSRAEREAEQEADDEEVDEDEAAARLIRAKEQEDRDLDEVREAGADDARKTDAGVTEYRVVVNGRVKWLTISALRELAAGQSDDGETLQPDKNGATRDAPQGPSPEAIALARRQEQERQDAEAKAYKARLKDLYTKASMGDEEAIDELAEIQAGLSRVTPDVLRIVDERVDARVVGRESFAKAVEWFEGEYADELASPNLKSFAGRRDREIATEHPDWNPRKRLEIVGKELRQIRMDLGGAARREDPNKTPSKLERKRSMPQVPRAGGRERPEAEPDEVQSNADAIRAMARSRGQTRAIKH